MDNRADTREVRDAYVSMAASVHAQIEKRRAAQNDLVGDASAPIPSVVFDHARGLVVHVPASVGDDGKNVAPYTHVVDAAEVRRRCRCAKCVDEFSGRALIKAEDIKDDVKPLGIQPRGNYAIAVHWSDGMLSRCFRRLTLLFRSCIVDLSVRSAIGNATSRCCCIIYAIYS